jgi:hypothetical protein
LRQFVSPVITLQYPFEGSMKFKNWENYILEECILIRQ